MTPVEPDVCPDAWQRITFAKDQPQYEPLPACVSPSGAVMTEWEPTAEERAQISAGGRVRLMLFTFGQPLQPVMVSVAGPPPTVTCPSCGRTVPRTWHLCRAEGHPHSGLDDGPEGSVVR